jgi:hypothetical protein
LSADSSESDENKLLDGVSCSYRDQMNEIIKIVFEEYKRDYKSTHFHRSSTSGLKTGEGSLKDILADEEGASGRNVASVDDSRVHFFLCIINGIFLV